MVRKGIATLGAFLLLSSCASQPRATPGRRTPQPRAGQPQGQGTGSANLAPNASSDDLRGRSGREAKDYQEVYGMYLKGLYETALPFFTRFERTYPSSPLIPQVRNLHGLCLLLTRRPQAAVVQFQTAIKSDLAKGGGGFSQYVYYNLATAQFEGGQLDEALQSTSEVKTESLDRDNQIKLHHLKAKILMRKALPLESARESLTTAKLLSGPQIKDPAAPFSQTLQAALQNISNSASLEALYREYEDSALADQVLFRLGTREVAEGNVGGAELHLKLMMSRFPDSPYYAQASELIDNVQSQNRADAGAVGVLLPLKGKFAAFGNRSLNSIELAFRIFSHNEPDSRVTLVVEDSGEEAETAVRALDRLVYKHHVVAVIGPLLSKGIDQVTLRAQELGVPLVSLARYTGVSTDYVFQAGLTLKMQAYEIARAAIERFGMKRFAMLFPNDKVGQEISQHFWDAVESMGGEVVGTEAYTPGETDFRQPVDKLSGTFYSDARARELEVLARERTINKVKKRTRKTEQFFALKPIVDYDAVFIPDEPKIAGQIFPTFTYRDIEAVKFLGTAAWDSPEFIQRVQNYGENTLFLDAFVPGGNNPGARKFIDRYKAAFGMDPIAVDAIAFDAASLLEEGLGNSGAGMSSSRADVRNRLRDIKGFKGVTGKIGYKDGQFLRDLRILTVRSGQISELE